MNWQSKAWLASLGSPLCACGCGRPANMVDHKVAPKGDKRIDLAAVSCTIELDDGRYALHVQSFTPEAQLRRRADNDSAPYPLWRDQGWLTECPGDIIDRLIIEQYIREL